MTGFLSAFAGKTDLNLVPLGQGPTYYSANIELTDSSTLTRLIA